MTRARPRFTTSARGNDVSVAGKDLLTRLADAGEDALVRFTESSSGERLVGAVVSLRERVDDLQRRVRGLDALERRVTEVERRLADVEGRQAAARRAATSGAGDTRGGQMRPVDVGERSVRTATRTPAPSSARER